MKHTCISARVFGIAFVALGSALIGAALLGTQTGCETQSAEGGNLRVEPHAIGLRVNQSAEFTATGGFSYKWTLSDQSLGFLNRTEGATVRYTSRFNPATNTSAVIQRLTVTSVVGGSRTSSDTDNGVTNDVTTDTGFVDSAEAIIEHLPTGGGGTPTTTSTTTTTQPTNSTSALAINPDSATVNANQSRTFTATGEGPNYSWSVNNASQGSLSATTGSTVTYTASGVINSPSLVFVTLTVTSNGRTATADIARP